MIENISDFLETFLLSLGVFAPILACFLIVIESILPVLPLCVFITINFYFFGKFVGFLLSWIFTCIGCYLSYVLVKKGVKTIALDTAQKSGLLQKTIKIIKYTFVSLGSHIGSWLLLFFSIICNSLFSCFLYYILLCVVFNYYLYFYILHNCNKI